MEKRNNITYLFLLFLTINSVNSFAQKTIVKGRVFDAISKGPLPFVNVSFKNSKIGATTDINGNYRIETYYATDSLVASFVGFIPLTKKVKKDVEQTIDFPLEEGRVQLQEVIIVADKKAENPAHAIFRKVIQHKPANNREKLEAYQYEAYNKIEFDVNNIDEEFMNKRMMKPFSFLKDNIDSTSESKPFLPMFMTESLSDYYYRKDPKSEKEFIKATKVSGVENGSISEFLGDMYQNVNIYENYITVFGKSFLSPIADFGLFSYRYYLTDSAVIDGTWCYKLQFSPKRKHELTFVGDMWIADTSYAVKRIEAGISGDANINWINEFHVQQEYDQVEKEVWMLTQDELVVDFNLTKKAMGLYGRKTSSYKKHLANQPKPDEFYSGLENVVVLDSAADRKNEFWQGARHVELTENEKSIYSMIDTLQEVPAFRTIQDIVFILITGYKEIGYVEVGPYSSLYSYNVVEGHRFRIGVRSSNKFSTRLMPEIYAAYGTHDNKFKYGASIFYFLSKEKPRQSIGASYAKDNEQLGQSDNAWRTDNVFTSVLRRNPLNRLNAYEEYKGFYEREWFAGFSNKISFSNRKISPLGILQFEHSFPDGSTVQKNSITTSEVGFLTRFAYKEKFVSGEFTRISLGTKYPILQAKYSLGIVDVFNGEYSYHKLLVNIEDDISLDPFGQSEIIVEAGKIWGTLPFPLLELHNGNENFTNDQYAFNLMNFYEFVSDEFASASITHHFNGLFLNKIPLLRKLNWRSLISGKGVIGRLDAKNKTILDFPPGLSTLSQPYYEGGVGIENIFKFFRVDALWRLAYVNKGYVNNYEKQTGNQISRFGIRGMFVFQF